MMTCFLSDVYLFPAAQLALGTVALLAFVLDVSAGHHRGEAIAVVTRGEKSMGIFYGAYGGLTAVFVALSLSVESASSHRTAFVLLDVLLVFYLCLLNAWFRNKLIGWTNKLPSFERRQSKP